jgi:outer membrane protein assembly factor BamB
MAVVPWLLTAFGALAGFVAGLLARRQGRRIFLVVLGASVISLAAAAWLFWPKVTLKYVDQGSRIRATADLPVVESVGVLEGEREPEMPPRAAWDTWKAVWSTPTPNRSLSDPLISSGLVIIGTWEGTVEAFSLFSGKAIWRVKKHEPVIALAAAGTLLLAGEGVHTSEISALTAISLPEGRVLWSREFNGHLESSPTIEGDLIYLGAGPAGFYCLRASDGEVIWKRGGIHVDSTPLVSSGTVYFAGQEKEGPEESLFLALDASTGKEFWNVKIPGQPWGSPSLDTARGQILITSGVGQIGLLRESDRGWAHAISLKDQIVRWTRPLAGTPLETSILLPGPGLLIATATKGEIVAIRAESGAVAWTQPTGAQILAQPDLDQSHQPPRIASLDTNGKLRLQSALTGAFLDEHDFAPGANSGPRFLPDGILIALPRSIQRYRW